MRYRGGGGQTGTHIQFWKYYTNPKTGSIAFPAFGLVIYYSSACNKVATISTSTTKDIRYLGGRTSPDLCLARADQQHAPKYEQHLLHKRWVIKLPMQKKCEAQVPTTKVLLANHAPLDWKCRNIPTRRSRSDRRNVGIIIFSSNSAIYEREQY